MKYHLVILLFITSFFTSAQSAIETKLLSSKSTNIELMDSLSASLLKESNPRAVILWHRHFNIQNEQTAAALWMLSPVDVILLDSSIIGPFLNWGNTLKPIKKPKLKSLALDSLLAIRPENEDQMIQRILALSELGGFLGKKRKEILVQYSSIPSEISTSGYEELRFRLALNILYKNLRASSELKANMAAIDKIQNVYDYNFENYCFELLAAFASEHNKDSQIQPVKTTEQPTAKNDTSRLYLIILLCLLVVIIALVVTIFILKKRNDKATHVGKEDFIKKEQQWDEKETLYHQQLGELKIKLTNLIAENDKLKLYYNSNEQVIKESKEQLEELQTLVKEQIDEVVKEPGVAQVMNLKNTLTRGMMRLRDALGK